MQEPLNIRAALNASALRDKMASVNVTDSELALAVGMSNTTLRGRMSRKTLFTQGGITAITRKLHLNRDDIFRIFFDDHAGKDSRSDGRSTRVVKPFGHM